MNRTHIDLFSGIGGFALAARWAGLETVQFVEIDPFCQKVLRKHWPEVPIHDDVATFRWDGERPFLLTGGFPCQPFSCAGKRRGKEDDRFLWPEMLRVISQARPTWVIGENVAGFINMGLDDCISDLEGEGYEVQAFVIPSCAKNAPHRRDRVWIVANSKSERGRGESTEVRRTERRQVDELLSDIINTDSHAPDTKGGGRGGWSDNGCQMERARFLPGEQTGCEVGSENQGCDWVISQWDEPWLEAATRLCTLDDGLSGGLARPKGWRVNALKGAGNAIVPQIAFSIIKSIVEIEETT